MKNPNEMHPVEPLEELAGELYTDYCARVGGKAFNGDPLPDWPTFRDDPKKQPQAQAWLSVARTAFMRVSGTVLSKKVIVIDVGNKNPAEIMRIGSRQKFWMEFSKPLSTDSELGTHHPMPG